jgi:ribosomal protein S18 acetylase RimI-like enzyme
MTEAISPAISLHEATPDDAPLVHRLMLAAYEEYRDTLVPASGAFEESVEDVRQAIAEGGAVIVRLDGEPVGCGRFEHAPDRSFIEVGRLSVLPAYRGRGLATRMLGWFEARAAELDIPDVVLGVRLNLPRNIALYERAGYVIFDYEDRPEYGRVAAWMKKRVARA